MRKLMVVLLGVTFVVTLLNDQETNEHSHEEWPEPTVIDI